MGARQGTCKRTRVHMNANMLLGAQKNVYQYFKFLKPCRAEAHSLFIGENPTIIVGKSKFVELRAAEVLLSSKMLHNICGCIYHANIALLLEELHKKPAENFPLYGLYHM